MCNECIAKAFTRQLGCKNTYSFSTFSKCPAYTVESFDLGQWSVPPKKVKSIPSILKDIALAGLPALAEELLKITGEFFSHRNKLNGIFVTSSTESFSKADQNIIQSYCNFMKKYVGHRQNNCQFSIQLNETARVIRWLKDANAPDLTDEMKKIVGYLNQFQGLQKVMIDCAVVISQKMQSSTTPPVEYEFHDYIVTISDNGNHEASRATTRTNAVDLTGGDI